MIDPTVYERLRRFLRSGALGLLSALLLGSPIALAEEIKVGGTGNALGTIRLLGEAFSKKYPAIKVTVLVSLGSSGALKAVPRGAIDIGLSSRAVSADERSAGIVSGEYARSLTVLAVPRKARINAITREQLADIYSGKLTQWPDGTTIRPVLRQPGDDNTKQLKSLSPQIESALIGAEQRQGLAFAVTDQEAADKIESIPGALGVSTLALIASEERALTPLTLDNIEPTIKNGVSGAYPLIKHFHWVTRTTPSAAVQKFIAFVGSADGQAILAQTGHWAP